MAPVRDWSFPSCFFLNSHRLESWAERREAGRDFSLASATSTWTRDFRHIPCQFRAGCREVAVDPQNVRSATQALGVTPRIQKNIPEGFGLIDRGKGHPPNGQPGNGQSARV